MDAAIKGGEKANKDVCGKGFVCLEDRFKNRKRSCQERDMQTEKALEAFKLAQSIDTKLMSRGPPRL
jgi:hypothetical protein